MLNAPNFLGILQGTTRLKPAAGMTLRPVRQSEMLHNFCFMSFAGFWFGFLASRGELVHKDELDG